MSADEPPAGPLELATIFRRRWAPQTIALLESRRGERFVSLCHELGAHQGAVRDTLDYLMEIGIVIRNPGYGHPLRPEYILTPIGSRVAPHDHINKKGFQGCSRERPARSCTKVVR